MSAHSLNSNYNSSLVTRIQAEMLLAEVACLQKEIESIPLASMIIEKIPVLAKSEQKLSALNKRLICLQKEATLDGSEMPKIQAIALRLQNGGSILKELHIKYLQAKPEETKIEALSLQELTLESVEKELEAQPIDQLVSSLFSLHDHIVVVLQNESNAQERQLLNQLKAPLEKLILEIQTPFQPPKKTVEVQEVKPNGEFSFLGLQEQMLVDILSFLNSEELSRVPSVCRRLDNLIKGKMKDLAVADATSNIKSYLLFLASCGQLNDTQKQALIDLSKCEKIITSVNLVALKLNITELVDQVAQVLAQMPRRQRIRELEIEGWHHPVFNNKRAIPQGFADVFNLADVYKNMDGISKKRYVEVGGWDSFDPERVQDILINVNCLTGLRRFNKAFQVLDDLISKLYIQKEEQYAIGRSICSDLIEKGNLDKAILFAKKYLSPYDRETSRTNCIKICLALLKQGKISEAVEFFESVKEAEMSIPTRTVHIAGISSYEYEYSDFYNAICTDEKVAAVKAFSDNDKKDTALFSIAYGFAIIWAHAIKRVKSSRDDSLFDKAVELANEIQDIGLRQKALDQLNEIEKWIDRSHPNPNKKQKTEA